MTSTTTLEIMLCEDGVSNRRQYMESVGCNNDEIDATEADIAETAALLASEWRHNQAQYVPTNGVVARSERPETRDR